MDKNIENKIPKIKSLFIKYGVKRAFLFGSIAKGINTNKSDVDFLFSFHENLVVCDDVKILTFLLHQKIDCQKCF